MPYKTQWLVPSRVLLTQLRGQITEEDVSNLTADINAKIEEGTALVHHINDASKMDRITITLKSARILVQSMRTSDKLGWHLEVTNNPINKMISSIGIQFSGVRYRSFNTLEEAVTFLNTNDSTLPEIDLNNLLDITAYD